MHSSRISARVHGEITRVARHSINYGASDGGRSGELTLARRANARLDVCCNDVPKPRAGVIHLALAATSNSKRPRSVRMSN